MLKHFFNQISIFCKKVQVGILKRFAPPKLGKFYIILGISFFAVFSYFIKLLCHTFFSWKFFKTWISKFVKFVYFFNNSVFYVPFILVEQFFWTFLKSGCPKFEKLYIFGIYFFFGIVDILQNLQYFNNFINFTFVCRNTLILVFLKPKIVVVFLRVFIFRDFSHIPPVFSFIVC